MEKVDPMYMFNYQHSLIDLSSDTRLKFSSQEAADWLSVACRIVILTKMFNIICILTLLLCLAKSFNEVKFSTRCWFLTLYCHHIALIPAFTKHTRRYRTARDLQKLVKTIFFIC